MARTKNKIKSTTEDRVFDGVSFVVIAILIFVCFYPIWYVFCASLTDPTIVAGAGGILLFPQKITLDAYKRVFADAEIWRGLLNTIFYTVVGTALNVILTAMLAYTLSRKNLLFKKPLTVFVTFTMFFNGGMIPTFMVMQTLGFIDKMIVMILPGSLNILYFFFMRLAIGAVPESLSESARLDGAGELRILIQIIMPLCMPTVAVVILFTAVAKWNDFMSPLIYLPTASDLYPLQMHIRNILNNANDITGSESVIDNAGAYSKLVQYATIVVSTLPIICVYPFVQKYFVKGILIGSVKG